MGTYTNKDYRCWVVSEGKIFSGWEYREDAQDSLDELRECGKQGKVLTRKGLERINLNPDNDSDWS